jgi:hypothetical protein
MKKILLSAAFAIASLVVMAQDNNRPAAIPGQLYGDKITEKGAIDIAKLPEMVAKDEDKKVQVKKKGCWVNLYVNDSTKVFVKMKDYGFFVPDDMVGQTVILEGEAFEKVTSVNELKHYAEDAKKSQEEIDKITEPEKSIRFLASGILVPKK